MTFTNRDQKRVRIQSGHQERIIERRSPRPRRRSAKKSSRRSSTKRRMRKMRGAVRRAQNQVHWCCKTHRPTVAEVVYQFLERASSGSKAQKSNATSQFRQLQRRKISNRPDIPKKIRPKVEAMDVPREEYQFPYYQMPSQQGEKSIERCIYEVLSFGTVLGLLVPADKEGMTFRVSSDIALLNNQRGKDSAAKRKIDFHDHDYMDEGYC